MTPDDFCIRLGIERTTLQLWLDEGWLVPQQTDEDFGLSEMDLARARLVQHLGARAGVNAEGISIVLDLVDQIHGLRSMLRQVLRTHMGSL